MPITNKEAVIAKGNDIKKNQWEFIMVKQNKTITIYESSYFINNVIKSPNIIKTEENTEIARYCEIERPKVKSNSMCKNYIAEINLHYTK